MFSDSSSSTSGTTVSLSFLWGPLVAQKLKRLPAMRETWVRSLGREDPLEKEMATYSSILAWRIPWTEEPGGLQSTGLPRVGHNWATSLTYSNLQPAHPNPPLLFYYFHSTDKSIILHNLLNSSFFCIAPSLSIWENVSSKGRGSVLAALHGMWDFNSLTRDVIHVQCIWSVEP